MLSANKNTNSKTNQDNKDNKPQSKTGVVLSRQIGWIFAALAFWKLWEIALFVYEFITPFVFHTIREPFPPVPFKSQILAWLIVVLGTWKLGSLVRLIVTWISSRITQPKSHLEKDIMVSSNKIEQTNSRNDTNKDSSLTPTKLIKSVSDKNIQSELHLICGPMFAGKSKELLRLRDRERRRCKLIGAHTILIKYKRDTRYDASSVVSHDGNRDSDTVVCETLEDAVSFVEQDNVTDVYIDEGQLFKKDLVAKCQKWLRMGKNVIIAILDAYAINFKPKIVLVEGGQLHPIVANSSINLKSEPAFASTTSSSRLQSINNDAEEKSSSDKPPKEIMNKQTEHNLEMSLVYPILWSNFMELFSLAAKVTKFNAVCLCCGGSATFSYMTANPEEIQRTHGNEYIAGEDGYESRCFHCCVSSL
jgi:thymidine kinase